MSRIYRKKKKSCINLEIDGSRNTDLAERFVETNRHAAGEIFVDETLLHKDGQS
jgi:hypothetical protein